MIITLLVITPLIGIFIIILQLSYGLPNINKIIKINALLISIVELALSLMAWLLFDINGPHFQFVQEQFTINNYNFYLGIDGLSIYFILLTTFMIPISILSNWKSINNDKVIYFLICLLLLESLLIIIFTALDALIFYIFFESILAPLFILINMFGSAEKGRASFYFFLYTFLGSLFMLLSIISTEFSMGTTDFNIISTSNFHLITQTFFFFGVIIAFAVKTPVIYLNGWLLKAHVESPLSGSIMLAAVVLKLSLYGIFRLILPFLPKAYINYTFIVFVIGVITVLYASISTIRTIDIKEIIAYSSVSHAAVYFNASFSNVIEGIQGSVLLGLAHGLVSAGLFFCVGGILYDRSKTRLISMFNGIAQPMPIFAIAFFILCLANCGAPLTLNFIGEFMSILGVYLRLPLSGILLAISIILSAAFTIFMFNRICFSGNFYKGLWHYYISDVNMRENFVLVTLVSYTVILGIFPFILLETLEYSVSTLIYTVFY
jgi:NADH-ubiquinone oxidoreductase chain 4